MIRKQAIAALALVASAHIGGAQAAQVYSQNFESGAKGAEWSGAGTVQDSLGLAAFGFGELHLKNDGTNASVLTLSGLAAHTQLTLNFSMALWDSIDLFGDRFIIQIDGVPVYDESTDFGNYFPGDNIGRGPGDLVTPPFSDFFTPNFGYGSHRDSARAAQFTVDHTGSSVVISWQFPNSQTAPDESFGLDNVVVSTNTSPVPLPGSMTMLGLGLAGMAALRRRRA